MAARKLIAYCLTQNLSIMEERDIKVLDSINISFGLINDGEVYWKEEQGKKDIARIRSINPEIQMVLSIGGWEADGFSQAAETEEGRVRFAESVIRLTREYGFDGIDVDWEYPCSDKSGIRMIPEDKENFTLLLRELRKQLSVFEEYKTLSIAAGALKTYIAGTNMKDVAEVLDYVQIMTYDLCGEWDRVTGHHAALYPYGKGAPSSDEIIKLFMEVGVPREKIVMGAAFYSRGWKNVMGETPGSCAGNSEIPYSYDSIVRSLETGEGNYRKFWDDEAKAAYLFNGTDFITYEDGRALQYKARYVKENDMYGMMYWEYGQDKTHRLTGFLREQLDNPF